MSSRPFEPFPPLPDRPARIDQRLAFEGVPFVRGPHRLRIALERIGGQLVDESDLCVSQQQPQIAGESEIAYRLPNVRPPDTRGDAVTGGEPLQRHSGVRRRRAEGPMDPGV
jgi:hypothetical protein